MTPVHTPSSRAPPRSSAAWPGARPAWCRCPVRRWAPCWASPRTARARTRPPWRGGSSRRCGAGEATDTMLVPSPEEAAEDARDAVQVVDPAAVVEVEGVEQERLQHLLPAGQ